MDFLTETQNLFARYKEGGTFRNYVRDSMSLVIPAVSLFVLFSVAATVATVLLAGGRHTLLIVLGLVLAPFIMVISVAVLLFVFFSWLEERSLARLAGRAAKLPPVPWQLAVPFVLGPLLGLALVSWKAALVLLAATAIPPAAIWYSER